MFEKLKLELGKRRMIYAYMFITIIIYFIILLLYYKAINYDLISNYNNLIGLNELSFVLIIIYYFFPIYSAISGTFQWKSAIEFNSLIIYKFILDLTLVYIISRADRTLGLIFISSIIYVAISIISHLITKIIYNLIKNRKKN
jgi:hypothetical protein